MMDRLPLELVTTVFECLEELNLATTPYSEFTEEPADQLVYGANDAHERAGHNSCWLNLTRASCVNILNARLAFSALYDASHKTFARLLGNRTFRLTNVGFQDLILISRKKDLLPYLRTLTLGCANFRQNLGINESGFVWPCAFLSGLNIEDRSRLAATYMQCRDWQHDNMKSHTQTLASILRSLPNLDTIRMVISDRVLHLGGWLKPGDEDLFHKDHVLYHDRSAEALRQPRTGSPPRLYNNESSVIRDCIMEAIKSSNLTIRDFRASSRPPCLNISQVHLFSPALHTLRVSLSEHHLVRLDEWQWSELFSQAPGLRDLSLQIDKRRATSRSGNISPFSRHCIAKRQLISDRLFQSLQGHTQLRRVELADGWVFSEKALSNFVTHHSSSLRCLLLSEPLLFGTWQDALRAIALATYGKAEFVKVRLPAESDPPVFQRVYKPELDLDSLDFSCPFVWITRQ
ncbi:hypothetical protein EKO04_009859 [Ascochyta lentis]|uniref:Uncharacterized protein n=1 Tax=Ascochyta lentis TaxID=205686 RepID=A0A8H7IVQ7_9PLEO|nr:hypothetical protein EKO04_009859 [Ascochyta lentis]